MRNVILRQIVTPIAMATAIGCDVPLGVEGVVRDGSHSPIAGATVDVFTSSGTRITKLHCNELGKFAYYATGTTGTYIATAEADGFESATIDFNNEGLKKRLEFTLGRRREE